MSRVLYTFETVFKILAAERLLKDKIACRTAPTPPGLSDSICGICLEIIKQEEEERALEELRAAGLEPTSIHRLK